MAVNIFAPAVASFIYRIYFGVSSTLAQGSLMKTIAVPGLKNLPFLGKLLFDQTPMEFFNPSAVIDQGTSGGHDPALHTYDIVLGKRTVNYCAWKTAASAKGAGVDYTAFEMNGVYAYDRDEATFTQSVYHYADTALLKAANAVKSGYTGGSVVEGTIGTSNEWNNQIDRMLYLNKTVGTSCEEMETDAAAQICQTYSVPYLGVRILSNTGIYAEGFDWKTGAACQNYVLSVAGQYISNLR